MLQETRSTLIASSNINHCPICETVGSENFTPSKIPVLSCEGARIRGEIACRAGYFVRWLFYALSL